MKVQISRPEDALLDPIKKMKNLSHTCSKYYYNPGHDIMGTFEFSGFLGKILKMLLLFAPFSPKSMLGM